MTERLAAYCELAKSRILILILIVTFIGYFLGARGHIELDLLCVLLSGTALTCGGSAVLNQYLEQDTDSHMERTKRRPLPRGSVSPAGALGFGVTLVLLGVLSLTVMVNVVTGFLALLTAFLYVLIYTPLKRITWWNTFIGAIPGALPPLGGWAAAAGQLELGAWVLFLMLFIWQHPHFYSIAWLHREDYRRGGLQMLPVVDVDGTRTFRQIMFYSLLLIPVSALPTVIGMSGNLYLAISLILTIGMLFFGVALERSRTTVAARRMMKASVLYLPIVLAFIVFDGVM